MKPLLAHVLRRCENPDCRVLFHPARKTSRFCRVCSMQKRLYATPKGGADGLDSRGTP